MGCVIAVVVVALAAWLTLARLASWQWHPPGDNNDESRRAWLNEREGER